jgi:hypothetical protein
MLTNHWQDGTCNGLQHYAALGRDYDGARHVNLVNAPNDRPQDVYAAVCAKVNLLVAAHATGDFSKFDPGFFCVCLFDLVVFLTLFFPQFFFQTPHPPLHQVMNSSRCATARKRRR